MTDEDDSALVKAAAGGDAPAFERLVERHYMTIYKVAYKWSGRREDAEDIAQDVCVKLPGILGRFRGESGFTTWLYRVTVNAAKDHVRARNRRPEQGFAEGFDAPSDEIPADRRLAAAQSFRAVHALPEPIRDAVLLVFGEELNHKEAARVLGCAETTISWRIFKARKLLAGDTNHAG